MPRIDDPGLAELEPAGWSEAASTMDEIDQEIQAMEAQFGDHATVMERLPARLVAAGFSAAAAIAATKLANQAYEDVTPAKLERWLHTLVSGSPAFLPGFGEQTQRIARTLHRIVRTVAGAVAADPARVSAVAAERATLGQLRTMVGRLAAWRQGHHGDVHQDEVRQWSELLGSLAAFEAAVTDLAQADAQAFHTLRWTTLPQLQRHLEDQLGRLRRTLQTFEQDAVHAQHVERALRIENDGQLHRGIATETHARVQADLALETALAPLGSWFSRFGLRTTRKIDKNEGLYDQMLNPGAFGMANLLLLGPFGPLLFRVVSQVAPYTPQIVGALAQAAELAAGL